jgi:hypothetical protein
MEPLNLSQERYKARYCLASRAWIHQLVPRKDAMTVSTVMEYSVSERMNVRAWLMARSSR